MNDPYREMPSGLKGTAQMINDAGDRHNGSTLAAIYRFDMIRRI